MNEPVDEARWHRLHQILDECLDLSADARAARLADLAREDAALASELKRLLDAEARAGLLDGDVGQAAPSIVYALAQSPLDAHPGNSRRIGHYRLIERIGQGGMGEVWRGERSDDFEQSVAIKLIRPLLDSPHLRERFARERRILARLEHPGIARLLDGGIAGDGTPWYAMEFVRGQDLVRHAESANLGTRARVELALQVCDAVAHAQAHLVVHRDLKPSNILVDETGRVRVLDFGIARLVDDSADAGLTATGVRLFSPAYAAPEQIRGEAVGTAADVFSLGAVVHELLTGKPPHPARSAAPDRLIAGLAEETAPRPSQSLRGNARTGITARELQGDLDTIVATALQPDPARRYAGAAQLADDLRRWLDGRPIAARPDTAGYRFSRFVVRHRLAVGSAVAVLLALLAGLGMALWQADVAREHARRADAEAVRAGIEAARAEHEAAQARAQAARTRKVKEFLVSIFVQADPMRRTGSGPISVQEAFDAALERARNELSSDPVLQADILDDFGEIRANQGRFDEAQALFEQAVTVAEAEYGPTHPALAESLANLGVVQQFRGDALAAAPYLERAVAILENDDGGDPLALANTLNSLSTVRQAQGDLEKTRELVHRALAVYQAQLSPDDPKLATFLTNAATLDNNAGHLDRAEAGFLEAMRIVEMHQGVDSPNLWPNLIGYANVLDARSRFQEATHVRERALAIARKTYAGDHRWVAHSLIEVGWNHIEQGRYEQGEAMLEEAVAMHQRLGSPLIVISLRRLGVSQSRRGDHAAARLTLQRGWDGCLQREQMREQNCVTLRANLAHVMAHTADAGNALRHADAALAELVERPGMVSEKAQAHQARAAAQAALGRHDEAGKSHDRAIALLRNAYGPEHPDTLAAERLRDGIATAPAARTP